MVIPKLNTALAQGCNESPRVPGCLAPLDLSSVTNRETSPDELQKRRLKFKAYQKEISEIASGIFSSGQEVLEDATLLQQRGITHIVNCLGPWVEESRDVFTYLTLNIDDNEKQDIISILHVVFSFIEAAIKSQGNVLVHCSQGVSRSPALIIAYLMWKKKQAYEDAFCEVKRRRGVTNPNLGFVYQLRQWHKTCLLPEQQAYRIGKTPIYNCRDAAPAPLMLLDGIDLQQSDHVYIFKIHGQLHIWKGNTAEKVCLDVAGKAAQRIGSMEGVARIEIVEQGNEPHEILKAFNIQSHIAQLAAPVQRRSRRLQKHKNIIF